MIESADAAGTTSRGPVPAPTADTLLVPGETCWRIERAERHAVFVDAADYFATLKRAVLLGTLLAAVLGGKAGQRYHSKIDRIR